MICLTCIHEYIASELIPSFSVAIIASQSPFECRLPTLELYGFSLWQLFEVQVQDLKMKWVTYNYVLL